jgi:hypothetical protein
MGAAVSIPQGDARFPVPEAKIERRVEVATKKLSEAKVMR